MWGRSRRAWAANHCLLIEAECQLMSQSGSRGGNFRDDTAARVV